MSRSANADGANWPGALPPPVSTTTTSITTTIGSPTRIASSHSSVRRCDHTSHATRAAPTVGAIVLTDLGDGPATVAVDDRQRQRVARRVRAITPPLIDLGGQEDAVTDDLDELHLRHARPSVPPQQGGHARWADRELAPQRRTGGAHDKR